MAGNGDVSNLFFAYGSKEEALRVCLNATRELRKHFKDKSSAKLSEKAEKIKEICKGFGNAYGVQVAKAFSVLLDEDLSYSGAPDPIPFVLLAAVIPKVSNYTANISFMLVPGTDRTKLMVESGDVGNEILLNTKTMSPATDEQITAYMDVAFEGFEGEVAEPE